YLFLSTHSGPTRQLHSFPTRRSSDLPTAAEYAPHESTRAPHVTPREPLRPQSAEAPAAADGPSTVVRGGRLPATPSWARVGRTRSEEHTSELQSRFDLVCRLLLEKKK